MKEDRTLRATNHVLRSQAICFEPKKSWKILADLPAEGRSPEAVNSYHPIWLAVKNDFEKIVWSSVYTAPSLVQKQMRELLIASGHKDPLYPKPLDASSPIYGQPVRTYNR